MAGSEVPRGDHVEVSEAPIDPAALISLVSDPGAGAVVLFLGTVRDHSPGRNVVTDLEYEAYREGGGGRSAGGAAAPRCFVWDRAGWGRSRSGWPSRPGTAPRHSPQPGSSSTNSRRRHRSGRRSTGKAGGRGGGAGSFPFSVSRF